MSGEPTDWSEPQTVDSLGDGWTLTRRSKSGESRYTAVMRHDGLRYYVTPSGFAKPFSEWSDARWYSSTETVRSGVVSWDSEKTQTAWSDSDKISESNGYYVYRQVRGNSSRYFVVALVNRNPVFIKRDGRYSSSEVFYTDTSNVEEAVSMANSRSNNGSQQASDGIEPSEQFIEATRTAGDQSDIADTLSTIPVGIVAGVLVTLVATAYYKLQ